MGNSQSKKLVEAQQNHKIATKKVTALERQIKEIDKLIDQNISNNTEARRLCGKMIQLSRHLKLSQELCDKYFNLVINIEMGISEKEYNELVDDIKKDSKMKDVTDQSVIKQDSKLIDSTNTLVYHIDMPSVSIDDEIDAILAKKYVPESSIAKGYANL